MENNVLFINACIRKESRTLKLAHHLLERLEGQIEEINLAEEKIQAIDNEDSLNRRHELVSSGRRDAPELKYAAQFASADIIVVAAPYWDMAFPALLKIYMEHVTVTGMTFRYSQEGRPVGMCRARRLYYVMTAGGPAALNLGYEYMNTLCRNFFGIHDVRLFMAENLDIIGNDPENILADAKKRIDLDK